MKRSEPSTLDRLRRVLVGCERRLKRAGWTIGIDSIAEKVGKPTGDIPAPVHDSSGPAPAGWYDDPEAEGVRRYWGGAAWTDSRVTTEGIPYGAPSDIRPRTGPSGTSLLLAAVLLVGGGICLWAAEKYKPSLSNQLGLNGNSHFLTPTEYHTLMVVGIVCLVLGAIRLFTALLR